MQSFVRQKNYELVTVGSSPVSLVLQNELAVISTHYDSLTLPDTSSQ